MLNPPPAQNFHGLSDLCLPFNAGWLTFQPFNLKPAQLQKSYPQVPFLPSGEGLIALGAGVGAIGGYLMS